MKQNPLLANLNTLQEQAVQGLDSNVLVDAGPGTGKTRVLTARIAWLLERGCRPQGILAITFTNKAAAEMSERVRSAGLSPDVYITTFHSWAFKFISERLPQENEPVVISEYDQKKIIAQLLSSMDIQYNAADLLERILFLKQSYPPRLQEEPREIRAAFDAYQGYLHAHGLFDYDELIITAVSLLEKARDTDPLFQPCDHLLVDEFQDVSPAQYRMCRLLAGRNCRVMAIGDPHQSIYGFRGSSPEFMDDFQKDFSPCKRIRLTTAYRCPEKFLKAAVCVLGTKDRIDFRSARTRQAPLVFRQFKDPRTEAVWIAKKIDNISGGISFESFNQGTASGQQFRSLSHVAVLFRINLLGDFIAAELERAGIPFQRTKNPSPMSEEKLNTLWHMLEFLAGRNSQYHLSMVSPEQRNCLQRLSMGSLQEFSTMPAEAFLENLAAVSGVSFTPNEKTVLSRAVEAHRTGRFLPLAMKMEQDCLDFRVEAVSLMSIHAAKGLEFPIVFVAGCEKDILPWKTADVSEERRLFYVGLTRASEQVFLTAARSRNFWGRTRKMQISPFIEEIRPLLTRENADPSRKRRKRPAQKKLF